MVRLFAAMLSLVLIVSEASHAEELLAARVLKRGKRIVADGQIDPNKPAAMPQAPSQNASGPKPIVEEDLVHPSANPRREMRPAVEPPPPPVESPSSANPPPVQDPARYPPPPPSADEMRPRRSSPQPRGERDHAGDLDEDSGVGVSVGIGFGSQSFSGSLGLTFPIYRWLAWGLSGAYYTWSKDNDKETRYGPEASLMVRIPSRLPITPFAGVGAAYDTWTRKQNDSYFDDASAPASLYFLGVSIPMARHLAINISQTWKTYLGSPPRKFDDHSKHEPYGSTRFDIGLSVVF